MIYNPCDDTVILQSLESSLAVIRRIMARPIVVSAERIRRVNGDIDKWMLARKDVT